VQLKLSQFKPTLAGTVATLALLPLLLSLGFWQLRRAEEKRVIIAQFAAGATDTKMLNADNAAELPYLQHVSIYGQFDSSHQVLLDNMPASKDPAGFARPGYRVLTPLHTTSNNIVLVDRGWVPLGRTRADLPDVRVGEDSRTVRGRLAELPRPGIRLSGAPPEPTWPRVLNYPTLAELQALFDAPIVPRIVLLDEQEPDGFRRDWSARYSVGEFGPDKHIGYAVQWFGLALALVVIYFVVGFRQAFAASDVDASQQ